MGLSQWLDRVILSRRRAHVQEAIRTSDDLLTTKRQMTRFSADLQEGRIQGQHKVIHIRDSILVRKSGPDFLDDTLTSQEGDRER